MPAQQPDLKEEKKGPRVGAPERRDPGFPKAAGLDLDRSGQGAARQEGRLLCRRDREEGPAGDRSDRRDRARGGAGLSRGRNRCAGARAGSPGCGRCIRSSRPSGRRPRSRRSCRSRSTASRRQTNARPPLPRAGAVQGEALRRLCGEAREGQGRARSGAAPRDHPRRRQEPRLRAGLRTGRGRGPAGRGRRAWSNGRSC